MGLRVIALRDHIHVFLLHNRELPADKRLHESDHLTSEDWRIIAETVTLLKPFYDQTKRLQSRAKEGSHGALWEAYTSIKLLINHIKQAKDRCGVAVDAAVAAQEDEATVAARKATKISLDNCWDKLDEYYRKYDDSPAYPAAVVLYPGLKWRYFESQWTETHQRGWLTQTKAVKDF